MEWLNQGSAAAELPRGDPLSRFIRCENPCHGTSYLLLVSRRTGPSHNFIGRDSGLH